MINVALQVFSIAAAFLAALFWLKSARVKISPITVAIMQTDGSIKRPPHEQTWQDQARHNAHGALCAAAAAVAQGTSFAWGLWMSN